MKPFQKWLVWASSIATALTGVVYFWMDRMMSPVDEWAVINHPLQPLVLKAHILVAPVLVFAIGMIAFDHIWKYWRGTIHRARRTGLTSMWPIVPMIVSGYLIQAVTHVLWLEITAWAHIGLSVAYLAALVGHQVAVRRSRLVTLQWRAEAGARVGEAAGVKSHPSPPLGSEAVGRAREGSGRRERVTP